MIDAKLLEMLQCPAEGGPLRNAEPDFVNKINQSIEKGEIRDPLDQRVEQLVDGGLVNESGTRLYPIRNGIPSLVVDESILLSNR
ncbi:MAG: Trm112 family protein [Rubripirellula sp.]|nr:Trm112 family protein [Rubripirellula sp.]